MKIYFRNQVFEELRRAEKTQDLIDDATTTIAARAGRRYVPSTMQGKTRYRGIVYPENYRAHVDNQRHNTLLKALMGGPT